MPRHIRRPSNTLMNVRRGLHIARDYWQFRPLSGISQVGAWVKGESTERVFARGRNTSASMTMGDNKGRSRVTNDIRWVVEALVSLALQIFT